MVITADLQQVFRDTRQMITSVNHHHAFIISTRIIGTQHIEIIFKGCLDDRQRRIPVQPVQCAAEHGLKSHPAGLVDIGEQSG